MYRGDSSPRVSAGSSPATRRDLCRVCKTLLRRLIGAHHTPRRSPAYIGDSHIATPPCRVHLSEGSPLDLSRYTSPPVVRADRDEDSPCDLPRAVLLAPSPLPTEDMGSLTTSCDAGSCSSNCGASSPILVAEFFRDTDAGTGGASGESEIVDNHKLPFQANMLFQNDDDHFTLESPPDAKIRSDSVDRTEFVDSLPPARTTRVLFLEEEEATVAGDTPATGPGLQDWNGTTGSSEELLRRTSSVAHLHSPPDSPSDADAARLESSHPSSSREATQRSSLPTLQQHLLTEQVSSEEFVSRLDDDSSGDFVSLVPATVELQSTDRDRSSGVKTATGTTTPKNSASEGFKNFALRSSFIHRSESEKVDAKSFIYRLESKSPGLSEAATASTTSLTTAGTSVYSVPSVYSAARISTDSELFMPPLVAKSDERTSVVVAAPPEQSCRGPASPSKRREKETVDVASSSQEPAAPTGALEDVPPTRTTLLGGTIMSDTVDIITDSPPLVSDPLKLEEWINSSPQTASDSDGSVTHPLF